MTRRDVHTHRKPHAHGQTRCDTAHDTIRTTYKPGPDTTTLFTHGAAASNVAIHRVDVSTDEPQTP